MEIVELFKDSLIYPTKNWDKLVILGVLTLIMSIFTVLQSILVLFNIYLFEVIPSDIIFYLSSILLLIITLIIYGYTLSITRKTIENPNEDAPDFDIVNNFVDGIKILILNIIYFVIPVAVAFITIYTTGVVEKLAEIATVFLLTGSVSLLSQSFLNSTGVSLLIVVLVLIILSIIFQILFLAAKAVLAETDSLLSAMNVIDVIVKIGEIKWSNYIIWLIIYGIILGIISLIISILSDIRFLPIIWVIINLLLLTPYSNIFASRSLGLMYRTGEKSESESDSKFLDVGENKLLISLGYLLSLLGGWIGAIIAIYLLTLKDYNARRHGLFMLIIGIVVGIFTIIMFSVLNTAFNVLSFLGF